MAGAWEAMIKALQAKVQAIEAQQQSGDRTNPLARIFNLPAGVPDSLQAKKLGRNQPYMRGGKIVDSSGNYLPLNKTNFDNGDLSLAGDGIAKLGSNSTYVANTGFSFTHVVVGAACTTTIHWDGTNGSTVKVIRRSDGTNQTIPPGNITVSGLAASTTYGILPYWTPGNLCTIGWVPGTIGTPQIVFSALTDTSALALQNYQSREPLSSGFMTFVTPAASGGGGGPAGGGCVMLGTLIEEFEGFPYETRNVPWSDWWRIEAGGACVNCVPEHRFYDARGNPKQAKDFEIGDWIIRKNGDFEVTESYGFMRACTKVDVRMERLHLYWANGFLSSNNKIADP